ncbi:MAG: ElyC/SanA/YdcF family protein [Clostridiaceae bacterium]
MKKKSELSPGKKKRRLLAAIIVLIVLCSLPFAVSGSMCASVKDQIITAEEASSLDVDCVLVLGALVRENGNPSGILEDRLITGIAAYKSGASDRLLMSGDHGRDDYDEVNAMKTYAIEQGIPSENIFMDHAGFSTYESLYRARDIFQVKTVLIVTQEYHLYRALYIANQMGLEAYGLAADLNTYSGMPMFVAREILARNKDFFYTLFMPEPTYLGEQIPIWGDGNLTND